MKKLSVFVLLIAFILSAVGCGGGGNTAEEGEKVAFKADAPTQIELGGPSLYVENYVDTDLYGGGYTLTVIDASGKEETINGATWRPTSPGEYTLKLTVGEESAEMKLTVTVQAISWTYSSASPAYEEGETVSFDDYIELFNIVVSAYNDDYELFVDRIVVDGQTIDVSEQDSYTLASTSAHEVWIKAVGGDGQEIEMKTTLTVRAVDAETKAWMDENNITVGGNWLSVDADNTFSLGTGSYVGNLWDGVTDVDVPYVAINGNFGIDKAVTVSFTGKGAPDIAFFVGEENDETYNGTWTGQNAKGLLANNGLFTNTGEEDNPGATSRRITVSGPNMYGKGLNFNRKWHLVNTPAAYGYLEEDHEYEYTMYYSQIDSLDAEGQPTNASDTYIKLVVIMRDKTTDTVVFDNRNINPATPADATKNDEDGNNLYGVFNTKSFADGNYFGGNILIYGRFGVTTKFKIEKLPYDASTIE